MKSLLRYPGGKSKAVKKIVRYFPSDIKRLVSPFIGGASVELHMASKGVEVFGYDAFEPLVEFWQCAIEDPTRLAQEVRKLHPMSRDDFYRLQREQTEPSEKYERAAIYFALNRSSFSGSTLSGGMSPNHPRFNENAIERVASFRSARFTVNHADFKDSLADAADDFLYVDPPYVVDKYARLYGHKGDHNRGFDHEGLADILRERDGWVLSYNDCDEVRRLYGGFEFQTVVWPYGMNMSRKSNEVVILSRDVAELHKTNEDAA